MRPVNRGAPPNPPATHGRIDYDFAHYGDALAALVTNLGNYCSYCERRIEAGLAVEHIRPKAAKYPRYQRLRNRWTNFLLACVNCNSTKGDKDLQLPDYYLPDRDNTFAAFRYTPDGKIEAAPNLLPSEQAIATATLSLTGLDKTVSQVYNANGKLVVLDRVSKRMETWLLAQRCLSRLENDPQNTGLRDSIIELACASGGFSIWMEVFSGHVDIRKRFIMESFDGTAHDCFDAVTTAPISPRPDNGLPHGGKI